MGDSAARRQASGTRTRTGARRGADQPAAGIESKGHTHVVGEEWPMIKRVGNSYVW